MKKATGDMCPIAKTNAVEMNPKIIVKFIEERRLSFRLIQTLIVGPASDKTAFKAKKSENSVSDSPKNSS